MKKTLATFLKGIVPVIFALILVVAVSGCQKEEGAMEKAGKQIDQGVEAVKESAEKTVDTTKDTVKQAGEAVKQNFRQ